MGLAPRLPSRQRRAARIALLGLLAAGLSAPLLADATPSVVASHLAGRWQASAALDKELEVSGELTSLVFRADAAVARTLPKEVEGRVAGRQIYLTGTLAFDGEVRAFLLTGAGGSSRLIVFKQGIEKPRVLDLYVTVAPAKDRKADLLFVGVDEATRYVTAFERATQAAERQLEPKTLLLLRALTSRETVPTASFNADTEKLSAQPDWQRVVNITVEELQDDPLSEQNNRCLFLQSLIADHLREIRIDLDPLIATLAAPIPTNQQKASQALGAAAKRPELFAGKEKRAIAALIPLVTSQRGRVVQGALGALGSLTGKDLGRDPVAWVADFQSHYAGSLELRGSVYEILAFLRFKAGTDGRFVFALNDDPAPAEPRLNAEEVKGRLLKFSDRAHHLGLAARVVVFSNEPASDTSGKTTQAAREILTLLEQAGLGQDATFAPETDKFFPPFSPGFP